MKPWPKDSAKRTEYVDAVFRRVAPRYDLLTRLLSWGQDGRWKARILTLLPPASRGARVLDLATGTGAFPILMRRAGRSEPIFALDRSGAMLKLARAKCGALRDVHLIQADLNSPPVSGSTFDVVLMGYGLRYLDDLQGALRGIREILRPGGVLITLDFGLPERGWYRRLCLAYLFTFGTIWGIALHGKADTYWHIVESLRAFPGQRALLCLLEQSGFSPVTMIEDLGGISVTVQAERPAGAGARRRGA